MFEEDFDPYDILIQTTTLLNVLSAQHNELVHDYQRTLKRLKSVEDQLLDLQIQAMDKL